LPSGSPGAFGTFRSRTHHRDIKNMARAKSSLN
jgi:hypothetical protein